MTWCLIRPYGHKAHIVKSMYSGDMVTTLCCQWLQKAHVLDVSVAPPNWYQPCKLCRRYEEEADTLGLLELIAKRTDETVELGRVTVEYQAGRGTYIYSIHYDDDLRHGWFDVSRAEVEALLAGKEKEE